MPPPTGSALRPLEEPYRSRAVPPGTSHYWSWLFAAREARDPLLGIYALMAEWHALNDPRTEPGVAQVKLLWWCEEVGRLAQSTPLHPVTRYLSDFPLGGATDWAPLTLSMAAAAAQLAGTPLERAAGLEAHAAALYGAPLIVAAELAGVRPSSVETSIAALAAGQYLAQAVSGYRREARRGRIPFAVDELLDAGIDNKDLAADDPPPRLANYLNRLRKQAAAHFAASAAALSPADRPAQRHLLVLATLGTRHLTSRHRGPHADFRLADLYNAWNAARRAAGARR